MHRPEVEHAQAGAVTRRRAPMAPLLLGGAVLALAAWELAARRRVQPGTPLATIRRSVAIAAPAEHAYALLVDAAAVGGLSSAMTVSPRSPNRWLWTFRLPAGLSAGIETVLTDARPGRRLALRSVHGSRIPFAAEFDLFPAADSGETILAAIVSLESPHRMPMTLVERPLRRAADRIVAGLLLGLHSMLEAGAAPGQPGGLAKGQEGPVVSDEDRGLGRVVYGRTPQSVADEPEPPTDADAAVQEASEESFPASDPPGYAAGAAIDPGRDQQAAAGNG